MEGMTKNEATHENEETAQAQVDKWRFVHGFAEMAVIRCAVELGKPDIPQNHGEPMTLSQLSSALASKSTPLFRIMRFLMNIGLFKEKMTNQGSMGYVQTPMSRLLVKDGKNSMVIMFLFVNGSVMTASWNFLIAHVLMTVRHHLLMLTAWTLGSIYAAENPDFRKLIDDAMACDTRIIVPAVLDGCLEVFDGLSSVVNVGGGNGAALRILVERCPWIHAINYDLPQVVSVATECEGIEHVGGDMFMSVPKASAAFLKILHNWSDDDCIKILKNCREAIAEYGTAGKVIIVDAVIEENGEGKLKNMGVMLDLIMLAQTEKGKERTAREWTFVLREAGFTKHTIKNIQLLTDVGFSLIEQESSRDVSCSC